MQTPCNVYQAILSPQNIKFLGTQGDKPQALDSGCEGLESSGEGLAKPGEEM
jgi:hypothetical protein